MTRRDRPEVRLFARIEPEVGLESRKECVVERLRSLSGRDAIADYDVVAWGKEIRPAGPLGEAAYCRTLLEHVEDLRAWLDERGVDGPGFDVRDVSSSMTGESYDVICLPAICLSVYAGEELVDVYPRRVDDGVETVDDGLAALAASAEERGSAGRRPS